MTKPTLTTTVISDLAWEQLTNMDAPANSPIASTVAGVAPVQSWEETDQVLPDIGQVDNELLAAAGLSNTILISVKTEEVLKTITVSIGDNGNWFVGGVDTGVAAQGTNEASIARPTGVYGAASVFHVGNTLTIGAGLMYCVKEGKNFFTMQTTAELNISVDASTTFVTIDRTGTVRTYSSGINLWTIPESQAMVALVVDIDGIMSSFAVPTVHNALLMASAVIPYSRGAIEAASTATLQATVASQFAGLARQSAVAAEEAKTVTQADAAITTTNAQLAEQYKTDAQAAATSAHQFADFADADRVATAADRDQVATDKAAVAADRSTVATDKGIVASDKAITLGYKNDAAASKNLAAEYAIKPENSVITGTVSDYSALHWAQKAQQWAQAVSSALVWKGQWSAASNTAPPTPAVGTGAHFYRISGAGTINSVTYEVGDYIHWDTVSLSWFKIDGTDAVMTVNGVAPVGGNVRITTITGNAATATKLATARTIGGVSFDGSANINLPGVNVAGTKDTSGNAATATKLATAILIAGKSFDGTANITLAASDVGAEQAGVAATLIGTHAATANVHAISAIDGLQALLNTKYGPANIPSPATIGALAATSYKPRRDSLNNTDRVIATTENKNMDTCVAGDFGLYNKANCANSPSWFTSLYYCETKSIYNTGSLIQIAYPYYNNGAPCYRNYYQAESKWYPWRLFNDLGAVFSGQMRGDATGGSFVSTWSRDDAPYTSRAHHSGSSFAPALNIRYIHNGAWAGTYYFGDLCEDAASSGSLAIGHVNGSGGEAWFLTMRGSDGYATFPNSITAMDYQIRSDRAVKGNFEPITNALEKVAALEVAIYDKFSDTTKTKKVVREYGTIANSMKAVDELLVAEDKGLLYNSVSGQLALLTAAVQELKVKLGV